jgi:hypothetical protein
MNKLKKVALTAWLLALAGAPSLLANGWTVSTAEACTNTGHFGCNCGCMSAYQGYHSCANFTDSQTGCQRCSIDGYGCDDSGT